MTRIAIVVQRYGAEINGGAELHARLLAQALVSHYEVDVLTSRAFDYRDWAPHYPAGEESLGGCKVIRFDHPRRRRDNDRRMPLRPKLRWKLRKWLTPVVRPLVMRPRNDDRFDGVRYLRSQGPTMDGLMDYIRSNGARYKAIIFMTALYHPTALGVMIDPARSILVPTLHDEKGMYLPHFHRVFRAPKRIMYNTAAEMKVAHRLYGEDLAPGEVCGVGIDLPPAQDEGSEARWAATAKRYGVDTRYVIYVGRIESAKGCDTLFEYFLRWRAGRQQTKLVVVGQPFMELPRDPALIYTGFVTEQERDDLIRHAEALVVPSRYESLSLVLLEGLAHGCAVVVNSASEVLVQHVRDSGVGMTYETYEEFARAIDATLARDPARKAADSEQGRRYVEERYTWPNVIAKFRRAIDN